ncbi:hypothetical protein BKA70DRAFT_1290784 [Coprinopsis sp. MPI-PUGE-AT-0042]|nr:hypothetical protein BKA70DRAFT_1290784 [Coprinopsis sp. MPI-PUGE-AT-0042]
MAPKRVKSRLLDLDDLRTIEDEFRSWDHEQCSGLLNSLARPSRRGRGGSGEVTSNTHGFQAEDFVTGSVINLCLEPPVSPNTSFVPPPQFEMCTPTQRSVYTGDDQDPMPFRPFSDDPDFPFGGYDHEYEALYQWQSNNLDPDCGQAPIVVGLTTSSLSVASQRRDLPPLPEGWVGRLESILEQAVLALETLKLASRYFCNLPDCIAPYCFAHLDMSPLQSLRPTISDKVMANNLAEACGSDCFLIMASTRAITDVWSPQELEFLHVVLDQAPDTPPCDLAPICRKPCREQSAVQSPRPCDEESECLCFKNEAHCTLSCRCDKKCVRQRKGCSCSARTNPCSSGRCSCRGANRDATLAYAMKGTDPASSKTCRNVAIQQGLSKATEVRHTNFGFGLFLLEDAKPNELVIEYTGELILDPTTRSRDYCATQRGRGYLFQLNSMLSIDSSYVGNASRYINHDKGKANCLAKHRIGVFAKARVLFDYGDKFFTVTDEAKAGSNSSEEPPFEHQDDPLDSNYSDEGASSSGASSSQ